MKKLLTKVMVCVGFVFFMVSTSATASIVPIAEGDDYFWQLEDDGEDGHLFSAPGDLAEFDEFGIYDPYGDLKIDLLPANPLFVVDDLVIPAITIATFNTPYFGFYLTGNGGTTYFSDSTIQGADILTVDLLTDEIVTVGGVTDSYTGYTLDFSTPEGEASFFIERNIAPAPEPATVLLLGAGTAGLVGIVRRRKKQDQIEY